MDVREMFNAAYEAASRQSDDVQRAEAYRAMAGLLESAAHVLRETSEIMQPSDDDRVTLMAARILCETAAKQMSTLADKRRGESVG